MHFAKGLQENDRIDPPAGLNQDTKKGESQSFLPFSVLPVIPPGIPGTKEALEIKHA